MFIYENHNILVCITGQYTAFAKYTVKHHIQEDHEHCKCLHQKKERKFCSVIFQNVWKTGQSLLVRSGCLQRPRPSVSFNKPKSLTFSS